nr:pentatricopeptide repeat-containing protein At5g21222-like [Ipomoea batatas]
MSHSPRLKTDAPNHEDVNTPTKKIKVIEVTNPRPDKVRSNKNVKQTPGATVTGSAAVIGSQQQAKWINARAMFEEMIKSRIEPGNHKLSLPKATSTLGSLRILNDDQSSVLIPRTDEKPVEDLQRVYQEKTNGSYKHLHLKKPEYTKKVQLHKKHEYSS